MFEVSVGGNLSDLSKEGDKVKSRDPRGNKKRQSEHERVSIVIKGLTGIGEKADTAE